MVAIHTDTTKFTSERAWGARDIAEVGGATVRLHWTDKPYIWHTNDGSEVFMFVEGLVDMYYKHDGTEKCVRLGANDIFVANVGDEHVAHPVGTARILVIEEKESV